jgi:hypothetical protein
MMQLPHLALTLVWMVALRLDSSDQVAHLVASRSSDFARLLPTRTTFSAQYQQALK